MATSYAPGILQAARVASKGIKHYEDKRDMDLFTVRVPFDAFYSVIFGTQSCVSNPNEPPRKENDYIHGALTKVIPPVQPNEAFRHRLGVTTEPYQTFSDSMNHAH